jgi:lipid II:glycine glycyltransferase (peptidoglycan interpeptide bridge formation enzyme)
MIDFAGVRTYLHGASSNKHRNLMAPYAIHWHQIQDAKQQGLEGYDFWGVSDTNKQWKGITRFKRGFKGFEIEYAGTFDYVLNSTEYFLYQFARRLRYGKRG